MTKKMILILLDACRSDYISDETTPFLSKLAKNNLYYKSLKPGFGFCERTEILVGKEPLESGYFTAIGRDPEKSPYKNYRFFFKILGWIEEKLQSIFFSKVLRRLIWEVAHRKEGAFYPFRIPLGSLSNFCLTEDGKNNLISYSGDSIYNIVNNVFFAATTSLDSNLRGSDQKRLNLVVSALDKDFDFYPIYISILDSVGHKYGPESLEMKKSLMQIDRELNTFYKKVTSGPHNPAVVFCGDHGMSTVTSSINIKNAIDGLKMLDSAPVIVDMFLDSTMARFWLKGKSVDEFNILKTHLELVFKGEGVLINRENYNDYYIPDLDLYGDCIWICEEGVIISPDYFNPKDKRILGMHGYTPSETKHNGCCIISGKDFSDATFLDCEPLTDVYIEMKKYFDFKK
jgi:predicted AlkP superfamily pyrophosphatase or phosphodiesterase